MGKAKITCSAVEVECPKCGGGITGPSGAFTWLAGEVRQMAGQTVECDECGATVTVPHVQRAILD